MPLFFVGLYFERHSGISSAPSAAWLEEEVLAVWAVLAAWAA